MASFKSDETKLKAAKLREQNMSGRAISEELGINIKTVEDFLSKRCHVAWWRKYENKEPIKEVSPLKTEEGRVEIANLYFKKKLSRSEICDRYGIPRRAVTRFLAKESYKDFWASYEKYNMKLTGTMAANTNRLKHDDAKLELVQMFYGKQMSISEICEETGLSHTTVSNFIKQNTHTKWWDENQHLTMGGIEEKEDSGNDDGNYDDEEKEPVPPMNGELHSPEKSYSLGIKTRYVISSCQNNTYINMPFLRSLENYCEHNGAQLMISPFTYNMNGILGIKKAKMLKWDDAVKPYLIKDPIILSDYLGGLVFNADIDILPTAVNPLSGFQSYNKKASGIFPHAKMHLESVPTQKTDPTRMLYTTGAVSQRNYIPRKAGQKASHHHVFGALIIEIDHANKCWYIRQLNATQDGSFQDLNTLYTSDGVVENQSVEAISWGDIHAEHLTQQQVELCFTDEDSIIETLRPKYQFMNDLSDFAPRNHHNRKDPHFLYRTSLNEVRTVEQGLEQAARVLDISEKEWCQTVVVNSNHDEALLKWLKEADYRHDPDNGHFFLKCQLACYDAIEANDSNFMIFEDALKRIITNPTKSDARFLRTDESFLICDEDNNGVQMGQHGHLGNNGARGSINAYTKHGTRVTIGHSHSANIRDGVYQAGVTGGHPIGEGGIEMYYNRGASSWSVSHVVCYPSGKRAIITTHGKNWYLKD